MQVFSRRMAALLIFVMSATGLGGCSLFEKPVNTRPPAPLKPIKTILSIKKIWSTSIGNGNAGYLLHLHPYVHAGLLYAVDHAGHVYAINVASGNNVWQVATGKRITSGISGGENKLFLGTQNGEIEAVSIKTHEIVWSSRVSSAVMAISRPSQGEIIVHTNAGDLVALDASTGNIIWTQSIESPELIERGKAQPLISGNTVISGFSTGKLGAFSLSDGTPLWQITVAEPQGASKLQRMVDVSGRIAVVDGVVFAASYHGNVIAATVGSGQALWTHPMSSFSGLTVGTKAVYVAGSHGSVWALDLASGASLWKQPALHFRNLTAPVIFGNALVVGDYQGYLHFLSMQTGAFIARSQVAESPIDAAPVVHDNDLFVQAEDGTLAMYQVDKAG